MRSRQTPEEKNKEIARKRHLCSGHWHQLDLVQPEKNIREILHFQSTEYDTNYSLVVSRISVFQHYTHFYSYLDDIKPEAVNNNSKLATCSELDDSPRGVYHLREVSQSCQAA
uniref:Uncharacterized protein n=1 Tax=Vespula pensylvanica TaxID=30213 RepID=A0A834PBH5_VESPE|nr:hypothetical protein H0235_003104 [Vespula pensylvanica]